MLVKITNTDNVIPQISDWTKHAVAANLDGEFLLATIVYAANGDSLILILLIQIWQETRQIQLHSISLLLIKPFLLSVFLSIIIQLKIIIILKRSKL